MGAIRWGLRTRRPPAPAPVPLRAQKRVLLPMEWGETPLVEVGDRVRLGQRVADGAGETVPLHASVSGVVRAIVPHSTAGGRRCATLVLESDGRERPDRSIRPRALLDELSDELLLNLLYESGIRLPDGQPLGAAVSAGTGAPLVISVMDAEAGDCSEESVILHDMEACLSGIWLLERLARPVSVTLVLGNGQYAALRAARRWSGQRLKLTVVGGAYPAGHPRRLAELLGEPGEDALVLPASAAASAAHAAYEGIPVLRQTVFVSWPGGSTLVSVPLGMPVGEVLRAVGRSGPLVLRGGPLTGQRLDNPEAPVVKGMSALTILEPGPPPARTGCIRCGRCARVCPMGLLPWLSQRHAPGRLWSACLRCGACQYVCPAGLPLLRDMRKEACRRG